VGLDHRSSLTRSSSYSRGLYFKRYRHDSVQITFLVFGECAETQPFLRRRPTRPHTPSGNVECPVDWTHPVLHSTLLSWRGSIGGLTRHDRGGEANNWARAPA
jgi:hypothetical protein